MPKDSSPVSLSFDNDILTLHGHLTMESVPLLQKQLASTRHSFASKLRIDLNGTHHNDTAGLAWLINLKADLMRDKIQVIVENMPESLKKLSRLSDADKILAIK